VGFIVRVLVNAAAIALAASLVRGIHLEGSGAARLAGLVLGLINALVRPVLVVLTLPLTLVTLGLFLLVLNGVCLALTAWLVSGFDVDGLLSAVLGRC
jgi:putative membrane protein